MRETILKLVAAVTMLLVSVMTVTMYYFILSELLLVYKCITKSWNYPDSWYLLIKDYVAVWIIFYIYNINR